MSMMMDRPSDSAPTPSSAEIRGEIRRLRLHGATTWTCRHCRGPIRVVSAASLPENCPACGHGTWTPEGRCMAGPACDAPRPADGRPHAHCPRCGEGIWRRVASI